MITRLAKSASIVTLVLFEVAAFASQTEWIDLKNSNGWTLKLPSCWFIEGIEGVAPEKSPLVTMRSLTSDSKCSEKFKDDGRIQIITPLGKAKISPNKKGEWEISRITKRSNPVERVNFESKLGETFAFVFMDNASGVKNSPNDRLIWSLYSTCGDLNLNVLVTYRISADEAKLSLKGRKPSELIQKIIQSLTCSS